MDFSSANNLLYFQQSVSLGVEQPSLSPLKDFFFFQTLSLSLSLSLFSELFFVIQIFIIIYTLLMDRLLSLLSSILNFHGFCNIFD